MIIDLAGKTAAATGSTGGIASGQRVTTGTALRAEGDIVEMHRLIAYL